MSNDANKQSGQLEFHDFLLKAMQANAEDIRKEVRSGRDETKELIGRLDEHIRICDRRYAAAQQRTTDTDALIPRQWVWKKLAGRMIDYAIFVIIAIIIFAFKNGFQIPLPH